MAYWVRKDSTFIDCYGNDFEIALLEDDTAGATTEFAHLELADCFETEYLKTGDPREPWGLQRLTAYLRVRKETDLLEDIRDADEEKYRLRLRAAGSGANIYTLKVRTRDVGRELYHTPLQEIVATCGIDQLQSKEWTPGGARISAGAMVREALGQVGWGIGFRFSSDWYPTSALADTDDPLNLGERFDRNVIYDALLEKKGGEDRLVTYYDLLLYLATQFQLLIKLDDNADGDRWRIYQRLENHDAGGRYYWDYNSAGSLTGSGTESTHTVTFDDTDPQQKGRAIEHPSLPALKQVRYVYEHDSLTGNLDPSHGFSLWSAGAPLGHTMTGSPTVSHVGLFGDTHAIRIHDVLFGSRDSQTAVDQATKYGRYTSRDIAPGGADEVEFAVTAATFPVEPIPLGRRWYYGGISILAVSANKWMDADGNWQDDELRIPIAVIIQDGRAELTSKVFTSSSVPAGTTAFQMSYYQLVDSYDATSKVGGIWYGRVEPVFKPGGNRETERTVYKTTIDTELTTETKELVFYYGQGPVANSTPGRLTYLVDTVETDANNFVRGDGAAGGGIDFARFWNREWLRQFRVGVLDRERTLMGAVLPGASDVVIEGSLRSDAYYRYSRNWGMGEVAANWVEIRSDSLSVSHEDLTREWDGIDPTDDGADPTDDGNDPIVTPFPGLSCLIPWSSTRECVYPMIESLTPGVVWNARRGAAASPDGVMSSVAAFSWSAYGLSKIDTGYVALPIDLIGQISHVRFIFAMAFRRDAAGDSDLLDILAGTAGRYRLRCMSTGVMRFAVDDNAGLTENVDSTYLVGMGDVAVVGIGVDVIGKQMFIYLRTPGGAVQRISAVHSAPDLLSGDFYQARLLTDGNNTVGFLHGMSDVQILSTPEFSNEAVCIGGYLTGAGVTDIGENHDSYLVLDDTNLTLYDLIHQELDQIAHGLAPSHYCRPVWDPTIQQYAIGVGNQVQTAVFGGAGGFSVEHSFAAGQLVRALVYKSANQRLYYGTADAAGTGSKELGYFDGRSGTWSKVTISTDYGVHDLAIDVGRNRAWIIDKAPAGLAALKEIRLSDGSLVTSYTPAVAPVALAWKPALGLMYQDEDGGVYVVVPEVIGGEWNNGPITEVLNPTEFALGGTPERPGLDIHNVYGLAYAVVNVSAADRIIAFYEEGQSLAAGGTFDRGATTDDCRGISLVSIGAAAPVEPIDFEAVATGATTANLSASAVTGATGYAWRISSDGGATWPFSGSVGAAAPDIDVTGLTPGTDYVAQLRSFSGAGSSEWAADTFTTVALDNHVVWFVADNTPNTSQLRFYNRTSLALDATVDIAHNDSTVCRRITHDSIRNAIYYPDGGTVRSLSLADLTTDTAEETIAGSSLVTLLQHVASADRLYFYAEISSTQIGYWDTLGGTWNKVLASSSNFYRDHYIAQSAGYRYGINYTGDQNLDREDINGSNLIELEDLQGFSVWVDEPNSEIYVNNVADSKIKVYSLAGVFVRDVTTIAGAFWPGQLAVGGGKVYWVEVSGGTYTLKRCNTDGTSVETIGTHTPASATHGTRGICITS